MRIRRSGLAITQYIGSSKNIRYIEISDVSKFFFFFFFRYIKFRDVQKNNKI
jgi:hypothetical protein